MFSQKRQNVVILGGGCTGWCVAFELAQRGVACTVVDSDPPGAFSSTRNQGWLQSGAFYAAIHAVNSSTAQLCRAGSEFIRSRYPAVVRAQTPCYFLFAHEGEQEQTIQRCREQDIDIQAVSMQQLQDQEPILRKTCLRYAVKVIDCSLDTTEFLQMVVHQAISRGVQFCPVSHLSVITPSWDGTTWHLYLSERKTLRCSAVVLACGVYLPEILEKMLSDQGEPPIFKSSKIPVLSLQGEIATSLLITFFQSQGPHLVPFVTTRGRGVTICLTQTDEEILHYDERRLPPDYKEMFAESLSDFYGGLPDLVKRGSTIHAHFYTCQKIALFHQTHSERSTREPILEKYRPVPGGPTNIFTVYPGKLTASPIVAQRCVEMMESYLDTSFLSQYNRYERDYVVPTIATQPYFAPPAFQLVVRKHGLVFDPLPQFAHKIL